MTVSLPSSEGWNWKPGSVIQRVEPRIVVPSTSTTATSPSVPK